MEPILVNPATVAGFLALIGWIVRFFIVRTETVHQQVIDAKDQMLHDKDREIEFLKLKLVQSDGREFSIVASTTAVANAVGDVAQSQRLVAEAITKQASATSELAAVLEKRH